MGDKWINQPVLHSALCAAVKVIAAVKLEPAEDSTSGSPGEFSLRDGTSLMVYLIREETPRVTWVITDQCKPADSSVLLSLYVSYSCTCVHSPFYCLYQASLLFLLTKQSFLNVCCYRLKKLWTRFQLVGIVAYPRTDINITIKDLIWWHNVRSNWISWWPSAIPSD